MGWANNNELVLQGCDLKDEKVLVNDNLTYLKKLEISKCRGIEWIMRSEDDQLSSSLEEIKLEELDDLKGVMERERGGMGIGIEIEIGAAAQPPVFSSLKSLSIRKCKKMRKLGLPVSALPNLEQINIFMCDEMQEIFQNEEDEGRDSATTLPKLRVLRLKELPRLRKVGLPAASGVPNLEDITIMSCGEIQEIFEDGGRDSATTLPKLRVLELQHLPRLRKVGLPAASGVPNLELIDISGCGEIQEIFEDEDEDERRDSATTLPKSKLRKLMLYYLPRLGKVGLPAASGVPNLEVISINACGEIQEIFEDEDEGKAANSIVTILPKLKELNLYDLPRLKRVSKATIISNSIQFIYITRCPELMNKMPLGFDDQAAPPPSVRDIVVKREWWESLEWDNTLLPQLLHPFLHFHHK